MKEQKDNLHYQHQYAEDLDEENMSEIDRLEIKAAELKLKFDSDCDVLIAEINALKKADEVKPVFPKCADKEKGDVDILHLHGVEQASNMGLTGYGTLPIVKWLTARAYIIEEINKANKGDNGFKHKDKKYADDNYYIEYYHEEGRFYVDSNTDYQSKEPMFYFRDAKAALKLSRNLEFQKNMKIYFGVALSL